MGVIDLWGKTAKDTDLNNINTKIGTAADAETAATVFGRLTKVANSITTNWTSFWQAWTAAKIDNLDAKISTRAPANTALSNATWTDARAGYLNNLDAKISTRAAANTALSTATWTNARAGYLDKINTNLDAKISTVNTNAANAATKAEAARVAAVTAAGGIYPSMTWWRKSSIAQKIPANTMFRIFNFTGAGVVQYLYISNSSCNVYLIVDGVTITLLEGDHINDIVGINNHAETLQTFAYNKSFELQVYFRTEYSSVTVIWNIMEYKS